MSRSCAWACRSISTVTSFSRRPRMTIAKSPPLISCSGTPLSRLMAPCMECASMRLSPSSVGRTVMQA